MNKLQIIMLSTLLACGSTNFMQSMEGAENENGGKSGIKTTSSNKSTEQINQDRIKETQAQTTAAKAQADALNADAFKKSNTKSPSPTSSFSFTDPSTWSSKSSSATTSRTSSVDSTVGFDIKTDANKSTEQTNSSKKSTPENTTTNKNNLTGKSGEMANEASSFADMAKELKRQQAEKLQAQSKNVKKPSETGPMVDEMDPNKNLTSEQRSKAMEESQSWISPYDGSKFQEWVESVMNLVAGKGYKTDAQIESETQAKKDADIAAQKTKISNLKKQQTDLKNQIDAQNKILADNNKIIADNQPSVFDTFNSADTIQAKKTAVKNAQAESNKAQTKITNLNKSLTDTTNNLNSANVQLKDMMTPKDQFNKNIQENSYRVKEQKAQDAKDIARNKQDAPIKQQAYNNATAS